MKYPISIIGLLGLSLAPRAQSTATLSTLPTITINLRTPDPLATGAFNHFEVIDQRADTARIGIHTFIPTFGHSRNRQLIFRQPVASEIAGYLNKSFARPGAHWSALIVLRNLWLSDANYLREDKVKDPEVMTHRTHIRLKAEIYAYNDSFYVPIIRFDTLQTYKRSNPYNNWNSYYSLWENDLTAVLTGMTDSASSLTLIRAERGRRLQLDEIRQFNRSRFDPAITGSVSPVPGVYASFQEFRDNTPSIQSFEVRQEKDGRLLYVKDKNGASQYCHDAWGYCDGKTIFIMREGRLFPVWKEGKAFYFYSQAYKEWTMQDLQVVTPTPSVITPTGRLIPGSPGGFYPGPTRKVPSLQQRIYTVDMDSGGVY
ncbi:hypothetical protein [Puia sp.]|jgi:hypothetical protein|uniref:hypothetical protein n=1 Tax=Puia sp. TaxID=2045100 RepID=UPI002F3F0CC0